MIDDETHVPQRGTGIWNEIEIGVNLNVRRVCEERRTSISFSY